MASNLHRGDRNPPVSVRRRIWLSQRNKADLRENKNRFGEGVETCFVYAALGLNPIRMNWVACGFVLRLPGMSLMAQVGKGEKYDNDLRKIYVLKMEMVPAFNKAIY